MVNVYMMPADEGDFIWVSYGENKYNHILIDGGTQNSGYDYANIIRDIHSKDECIEAIILTHIDNDHLQGALKGISEISSEILRKTIKKIYFNTCRGIVREQRLESQEEKYAEDTIKIEKREKGYGVGEALSFLELLNEKGLNDILDDYVVSGRKIALMEGAILNIISPTEKQLTKLSEKWEDYENKNNNRGYSTNKQNVCEDISELMVKSLGRDSSVNNASSIAFIFEYKDVKIAFLADALPTTCVEGVKNLIGNQDFPVDALKLSHHGSRSNISNKLIKRFPTNHYLLSTNGRGEEVPNKIMIAHLLDNNVLKRENTVELLCNYNWWERTYGGKYFTDKDNEEYLKPQKLVLKELDEEGIDIKDGLRIYGEY